ncbi:hypothetical protein [Virgisporangium ochraceum]|uniref:hypothetical protein n=1 Tax=Virgisporangium ochraceum TaxID=65505 RepID=UPI001942762A|nr:hypothetical protein [Virgisporangium ochraceum]
MRRALSILLAVALLGGVAAAIYFGRESESGADTGTGLTELRGVIGSEKRTLFDDPEFARALAKHGLTVTVDQAGSRRIAELDLAGVDFAFPSSLPSAEKIQRTKNIQKSWSPFYSPMAVATFTPVADVLEAQGLVRRDGTYRVLDVRAFVAAAGRQLRWNAIPNNTAYPASQVVAITTTHPRDSNSAAMFAAVVSYVLNDQNVVRDQAQLARVLERVVGLFLAQGYLETSTEGPWESYLATGLNFKPLVWVYEAQYVGRLLKGGVRPDSELIYPSPTVLSKHTLVPLTDGGDRLGRLLTEDPELQRLAAKHGFRTTAFSAVVGEKAPDTVPNSVDPPAFEMQEAMLDEIARRYK